MSVWADDAVVDVEIETDQFSTAAPLNLAMYARSVLSGSSNTGKHWHIEEEEDSKLDNLQRVTLLLLGRKWAHRHQQQVASSEKKVRGELQDIVDILRWAELYGMLRITINFDSNAEQNSKPPLAVGSTEATIIKLTFKERANTEHASRPATLKEFAK